MLRALELAFQGVTKTATMGFKGVTAGHVSRFALGGVAGGVIGWGAGDSYTSTGQLTDAMKGAAVGAFGLAGAGAAVGLARRHGLKAIKGGLREEKYRGYQAARRYIDQYPDPGLLTTGKYQGPARTGGFTPAGRSGAYSGSGPFRMEGPPAVSDSAKRRWAMENATRFAPTVQLGTGTAKAAGKVARFALENPLVLVGGAAGAYALTSNPGGTSPTLDGAKVNTRYNQQAIAAENMQRGVAPAGMTGSAPQMMSSWHKQMQMSTGGLVQGLHAGRHG